MKRLELSKLTVIPSLSQQTRVVQVVVAMCAADPFCRNAFRRFVRFGSRCRIVYQETPVGSIRISFQSIGGCRGRLLISRCDDDDILPIDFVQRDSAVRRCCEATQACCWNGLTGMSGIRAACIGSRIAGISFPAW